jgi:hypothetical protein
LAYLAAMLARRRTGRTGGPVQVRVNATGCVQDDNPSDGPHTGPLRMVSETFVLMIGSAFGLLDGRLIFLWIGMFAATVVSHHLLPLRAAARSRRMVMSLPRGTSLMPPWRGWWTPAPVAWSLVSGATLEPLPKPTPDATHQLRIQAPAPWWRSSDREPVHLQFRCTPEQAAELSGRIVAWRQFARRDHRLGVNKAPKTGPPSRPNA